MDRSDDEEEQEFFPASISKDPLFNEGILIGSTSEGLLNDQAVVQKFIPCQFPTVFETDTMDDEDIAQLADTFVDDTDLYNSIKRATDNERNEAIGFFINSDSFANLKIDILSKFALFNKAYIKNLIDTKIEEVEKNINTDQIKKELIEEMTDSPPVFFGVAVYQGKINDKKGGDILKRYYRLFSYCFSKTDINDLITLTKIEGQENPKKRTKVTKSLDNYSIQKTKLKDATFAVYSGSGAELFLKDKKREVLNTDTLDESDIKIPENLEKATEDLIKENYKLIGEYNEKSSKLLEEVNEKIEVLKNLQEQLEK